MDENQTNVLDRPFDQVDAYNRQLEDDRAAAAAKEKATAPKTANEVLARVDEDHNYRHEPIDMNTTGGVQKAIQRNWAAIQALADFVDDNAPKVI